MSYMRPCALKSKLMFILSKNLNSLGPKTPINMYSMPILRLEVVLHIFMPKFPTVRPEKLLILGFESSTFTYISMLKKFDHFLMNSSRDTGGGIQEPTPYVVRIF